MASLGIFFLFLALLVVLVVLLATEEAVLFFLIPLSHIESGVLSSPLPGDLSNK